MTTNDTPASVSPGEGILCPKCHEQMGEVQRPRVGVLAFKCNACGHQWWLVDRTPEQDSER